MAKPKKNTGLGLPAKSAGMAASAVVSMAILLSVANRQEPFQIINLALLSGGMSGVLGYWIGLVLNKPKAIVPVKKADKPTAKKTKGGKNKLNAEPTDDYAPLGNVTGDESFLDDISVEHSSEAMSESS